jgi:hypothetical protein
MCEKHQKQFVDENLENHWAGSGIDARAWSRGPVIMVLKKETGIDFLEFIRELRYVREDASLPAHNDRGPESNGFG